MNEKTEVKWGVLHTEIEILERIDHLKRLLQAEETPESQDIQRAIDIRGTQTDIDVLASCLDADEELSLEAARWIDYQAQFFHRVGNPSGSLWWLCPQTGDMLVAGLRSRCSQVRWYLLSAYPVLQFGDPCQVLPILLDRLTNDENDESRSRNNRRNG